MQTCVRVRVCERATHLPPCTPCLHSVAGVVAAPGSATYSASKFAVEGITDSLRLEVSGWPQI